MLDQHPELIVFAARFQQEALIILYNFYCKSLYFSNIDVEWNFSLNTAFLYNWESL